jgi:hypothetical protein
METEQQDQRLSKGGVFFLPWIGENYKDGFCGHRLLVLGESHYNEWDGKGHELECGMTRDCVQDAINRVYDSKKPQYQKYWQAVEQALLNQNRERHPNGGNWAPGGGDPLWSTLAFYNFVQSPVRGGPRARPTGKQFRDSDAPFRAVLEELRPDRIWATGKVLFKCMGKTVESLKTDILEAYQLDDDTKVWCFATSHPTGSRGRCKFRWETEYPRIMAFLDDPKKFAEML